MKDMIEMEFTVFGPMAVVPEDMKFPSPGLAAVELSCGNPDCKQGGCHQVGILLGIHNVVSFRYEISDARELAAEIIAAADRADMAAAKQNKAMVN